MILNIGNSRRFVMENKLCVNGFSAVSEKEMMEVDGGFWGSVFLGTCFVVGMIVGAIIAGSWDK
jgi:lactobin A/cerein 7B family class IIb bacteriocin